VNNVKVNLPDAAIDGLPATHVLKKSVNRIKALEFDAPVAPTRLEDLGEIPDEFKYVTNLRG
jgi:hypothetical protein